MRRTPDLHKWGAKRSARSAERQSHPVEELLRIGDVWRAQILPSLDMMPRREQPRDRLEEPTDDNVLIDDPARLTGDFDPA